MNAVTKPRTTAITSNVRITTAALPTAGKAHTHHTALMEIAVATDGYAWI